MKLHAIKQLVVAGALLVSTESFATDHIDSKENMSENPGSAKHISSSTSTTLSSISESSDLTADALKTVDYSKIVGSNIIKSVRYEYCDGDGEFHGAREDFYETTYKLRNSCFDEIKIVKLNDDFGIVLKIYSQDTLQNLTSLNQDKPLEYNEDSLEIIIGRSKTNNRSKQVERLSELFEAQNEWMTPKLFNDIATSLYAQTEDSVMNCLSAEFNTLSNDFTNAVLLDDFKKLFRSLANMTIYRHNACTNFLLHPDLKPWLSHQPFLELYIDLFSLLPKPSRYDKKRHEIFDNIRGEIANACFNFYSKLKEEPEDEIALKFYKQTLYFSMGNKYQSLANKAFHAFTLSSPSESLSCYEGPNIIVTKETLNTTLHMSMMIRKLKRNLETGEKK